MCGIAGIVAADAGRPDAARPDADTLRAMTATLAHRGPDGDGHHLEAGVALGHRRLAVVDLGGGQQPMSDPDREVWVTFNGEIYNHLQLRSELGSRAEFTSRCDTEVLVHGWRVWGTDLFPRLRGMFAVALWDRRRGELILARDRMGQKPLYWSQLADGTLLFGSEAKALLAHPEMPRRMSESGIVSYLTYEYLPPGRTAFEGVEKLSPGHLLRFRDGRAEISSWWTLPSLPQAAPDDPVASFREHFDAAVAERLMADVPLGVFLSGGIDSSAVTAAMAQIRPAETLDTFSIGFDEASFDETSVARRVARYLGTRHHERSFRSADLRDVLPRVVALLDEPLGDPSLLPTYLLSAFTREHVTVALGGDGGDELMLGYAPFAAEGAAALYRRLPAPLQRAAAAAAARLPVDRRNFSPEFVLKRFIRGAAYPDADRHPVWLGSVLPGATEDPLLPELRQRYPLDTVLSPSRAAYATAHQPTAIERIGHQYCLTYLPDDILHKVDRASMMSSLEVRSPFLAVDLVEMVARLPLAWKRHRGRSKVVLRQAFADRLPKEVLRRPKKGFGIPLAAWLRGPLRELLVDTLSPERIGRGGLLDARSVARLVDEHLRGRRNHHKLLWTLIVLELWRERHGV